MNFAVLQSTLDIPPIERLQRAFQQTSFLVPLDAFTVANDAFGILLKDLSHEKAAALSSALQREGIQTEVVAQNDLPPLAPQKWTNRLDCHPDGLMIFDPIGRPFRVEWKHIALVAAGYVFGQVSTRTRKSGRLISEDDVDGNQISSTSELHTVEERASYVMLEVILTGAVLRYSLNVDSRFPFQYLGAQQIGDAATNISKVLRDFARFAPHALMNRGALYVRENATSPFNYPSKNAFYEETTWLLWQMKKAGKL